MARRSTGKCVIIKWSIENFNFCWHKTGERLESPSFNIKFSSETSWRLWLYPRGEDDGEYISFFLFREEGGPELVHVDFQLYLYVSGSIVNEVGNTFSGFSFNIGQREGLKCFASRWKILAPKDDPLDKLVLHLRCIILNRGKGEFSTSMQDIYTRVGKEHFYGTEICDDNATDLDPNCSEEIEVKPELENEPFLKINLVYLEDSLVVKVLPVSCKKIKYAICKITIIKNWEPESPIERFRSWIGEVKADIWKFRVLLSEKESSKPDIQEFTNKVVFVRYDFAFSTGEVATFCEVEECEKYLMTSDTTFQQYLNAQPVQTAPTALESLVENYRSKSFVDVNVKTRTGTYPAHKAILCVRLPKLKSMIEGSSTEVKLLFAEDSSNWEYLFFLFLYTDTLGTPSIETALELYKTSLSLDFEPLKLKCRSILLAHLNSLTAAKMYNYVLSQKGDELPLRTDIKNYIAAHYDLVMSSTKWEEFAGEMEFRKELIFSKYRNQSPYLSTASKINNLHIGEES